MPGRALFSWEPRAKDKAVSPPSRRADFSFACDLGLVVSVLGKQSEIIRAGSEYLPLFVL
jgi:hypothetical protein